MPMVWCLLMPNKAEETYLRLFNLIQDLLNQAKTWQYARHGITREHFCEADRL